MNRENELNYFRNNVLPKYVTKPVKETQEAYLQELKDTRTYALRKLKEINTRIAELENILARA